MTTRFGGPVLVLDRDDINTDEIIPAKYLTEITKPALKPHLLEDLDPEGFAPGGAQVEDAAVILSRRNFGCGSSREHAAWALEVNGITAVVAESFSRIFRQNMFNCGLLAVELGAEDIDALFQLARRGRPTMRFDLAKSTLTLTAGGRRKTCSFALSDFDRRLLDAGGWVAYADAAY